MRVSRTLKTKVSTNRCTSQGFHAPLATGFLGMNATRLYTLKYGQNRQVLSIGRVQTPTLALIVNRQREIENFVPEPYWVLSTIYRGTTFTATKGKYLKKEEGEAAFSIIEGRPFTVTKVEKKKGKEQCPQLFDLTSLQVECNKKFSYSADMTLRTIQSLYEGKFTTYPRVDTQYLSDDIYANAHRPSTVFSRQNSPDKHRMPTLSVPWEARNSRNQSVCSIPQRLLTTMPSSLPECLPMG